MINNCNYALQMLEYNLSEVLEDSCCEDDGVGVFVKLRYLSNLCFIYVVQGNYSQAIAAVKDIQYVVDQYVRVINHNGSIKYDENKDKLENIS